jgi:hypothetical protein
LGLGVGGLLVPAKSESLIGLSRVEGLGSWNLGFGISIRMRTRLTVHGLIFARSRSMFQGSGVQGLSFSASTLWMRVLHAMIDTSGSR